MTLLASPYARRPAADHQTLRLEQVPSWSDVAAMNRHLRRIWSKVQLDLDMAPTAYWRDPRWRYDPEQQLRQEDELRDPEPAGLIVLPVTRAVAAG